MGGGVEREEGAGLRTQKIYTVITRKLWNRKSTLRLKS